MAPRTSAETLAYGVAFAFFALMAAVTVPIVVNEPYGRTLVGAQLDSGSRLFTLLFPTALWALFVLVGFASTLFVGFQALKRNPGFADFWERFLPSSPASA